MNKSKSKKLNNKQVTEFPRFNYINKTLFPLKGKCHHEYIEYKVEVYNNRPNNNNDNNKKCTWAQPKELSRNIILIEVIHEIYRHRTSLSNYVW